MIDLLFLALVILILVDAGLTMLIIKRGGGREANPLLKKLDAWLRARGSHARWGWLAVSRACVLVLIGFYYAAGFARLVEGAALLGILTALYAFVCLSNWRVLRGKPGFFN